MYKEMSDWLCEVEITGTRADRFYEEFISHYETDELKRYASLLKWLDAAFQAGKESTQTDYYTNVLDTNDWNDQ